MRLDDSAGAMDEKEYTAAVTPWRRLGFWNKAAAITLGYGGLTLLVEMEFQWTVGGLDYLNHLDGVGLLTLIIVSGSLGTHSLRTRCFARDEWRTLQRVASAMNAILALISLTQAQFNLAVICVLTCGVHMVMPRFMQD